MAKKKSVSKTPKAAAKSPAPKAESAPAKAVKKSPAKKATKSKAPAKSGPKKVALLSTQKQKRINPWPIVLIILGLIIVIAGVILLSQDGDEVPDSQDVLPSVVASVNGVEIMSDTLEKQYAMLPDQYKAVYTKELVLEQLVSEELIIQYGEAQGFSVSQEEVQEEIQGILAGGMTVQELEENLANFDMTFEDFEALIERKLMIERSMAALLADAPAVSDAAVRDYYDENKASFETPEQVTVRHILIASQRENAAQFSKDLMEQLQEDSSNFCELVVEETDDAGSKNTCGEYTFPRGMMVPEFEQASFDMSPGDVTLVQTQFGYHIIEKLADVPEGMQSFADVEESIRAALVQEAQSAYYGAWLVQQEAVGDIEMFI